MILKVSLVLAETPFCGNVAAVPFGCAGTAGACAKSMGMLRQQKRISAASDLTVSATLRPPTFCLILIATVSG